MTALILLSEWQKSQIEFWRQVRDFPRYDVSSLGRVRNSLTGRTLKPEMIHDGYLRVRLYRQGGKLGRLRLNRLVAQMFISNERCLPVVNHLSAVKQDNRKENLEWASRAENEEHAQRHGLKASGARNGQTVLSDEEVRKVRRLRAEGVSGRKVGAMLGVSQTAVWYIEHRRNRSRVI